MGDRHIRFHLGFLSALIALLSFTCLNMHTNWQEDQKSLLHQLDRIEYRLRFLEEKREY